MLAQSPRTIFINTNTNNDQIQSLPLIHPSITDDTRTTPITKSSTMDFKSSTTTTTTMPSYPREKLPEYASDTSTPPIPTAIKATYKSSLSKLMCISGKEIHLTPCQPDPTGGQTSYKLSLPRGYYGNMTLASNSSAPLARAMPEGRRGYDILLPGSSVAETLRRESRKNKWWFALPAGPNGEMEKFEWRRSRGSEIKQLGASWRGWKLVRTRSVGVGGDQLLNPVDSKDVDDESLPGYSSEEEQKSQNGEVLAGEGSEVVAVWAKTGTWTSLHDVGELAFLNSGATGELGQRWAMMVLMSSLSIWQKAMRDQAMAGATASATSVTSVTVSA